MTNWQTTKTTDGGEMSLYIARPNQAPKGGILIFQEIFGVNQHIKEVTEKFASLGLLAVAPDLFHRSQPRFAEEDYTNNAKGREYMQNYTSAHMSYDIEAAYKWLRNELGNDNIAASGYCLGGKLAFLANATQPLKCAISYYGNLGSIIEQAKNQHGPLLMCWGGKDEHLGLDMPHQVVKELKSAGKTFTNAIFSDAGHGFFCDKRDAYNPAAAKQSWALVKEFLAQ